MRQKSGLLGALDRRAQAFAEAAKVVRAPSTNPPQTADQINRSCGINEEHEAMWNKKQIEEMTNADAVAIYNERNEKPVKRFKSVQDRIDRVTETLKRSGEFEGRAKAVKKEKAEGDAPAERAPRTLADFTVQIGTEPERMNAASIRTRVLNFVSDQKGKKAARSAIAEHFADEAEKALGAIAYLEKVGYLVRV
jgi:DNA repair ATPase RecN